MSMQGGEVAGGSGQGAPEQPARRTWRSYAGRENGKEGYQFGDFLRGAFKGASAGGIRGQAATEAAVAAVASKPQEDCDEAGDEVYLREIAHLRTELEELRERFEGAAALRAAAVQGRHVFGSGALLGAALALLLALVMDALLGPVLMRRAASTLVACLAAAAPMLRLLRGPCLATS
mmetsp:Transcript_53221/g.116553  ORF Transcript_53221/g.116553 Transcript_53221/m.116553 type:complete len:177 (+) Transcript_53221:72-602(+)